LEFTSSSKLDRDFFLDFSKFNNSITWLFSLIMGRRAKNKQGDPVPIRDAKKNAGRLSPKKLGKRKADGRTDVDSKESSRPTKKAKGIDAKVELRTKSNPNIPGKGTKVGRKSKAKLSVLEGSGEDSEGWEDVEDGVDLKSQAMCVEKYCSKSLF
jgi:ribosomal RNA methyltransferase Nop2